MQWYPDLNVFIHSNARISPTPHHGKSSDRRLLTAIKGCCISEFPSVLHACLHACQAGFKGPFTQTDLMVFGWEWKKPRVFSLVLKPQCCTGGLIDRKQSQLHHNQIHIICQVISWVSSHSYLSQEPLSRQNIKINSCQKTEILSCTMAMHLRASYLNASWEQTGLVIQVAWCSVICFQSLLYCSWEIFWHKQGNKASFGIQHLVYVNYMNNMRLKVRRSYLLLDTCVQTHVKTIFTKLIFQYRATGKARFSSFPGVQTLIPHVLYCCLLTQ